MSANHIRNGATIEWKNNIYNVVEFQHVKPGKGGAFIRTKLKDLKKNTVINVTFSADQKIKIVRVEKRKYQYLYTNNSLCYFMDTKNFEEKIVSQQKIVNSDLLLEGESVYLLFNMNNDEIIDSELPTFVTLKIKESEKVDKGNTVNNVTKKATLETGTIIQVPAFIQEGDVIKIDTRTRSYIERV